MIKLNNWSGPASSQQLMHFRAFRSGSVNIGDMGPVSSPGFWPTAQNVWQRLEARLKVSPGPLRESFPSSLLIQTVLSRRLAVFR